MSAIAGLYRTDGRPVNRHEVDRMVLALAHRGPDGTGAWSGGPVALAHGALWTTPESRGEERPWFRAFRTSTSRTVGLGYLCSGLT